MADFPGTQRFGGTVLGNGVIALDSKFAALFLAHRGASGAGDLIDPTIANAVPADLSTINAADSIVFEVDDETAIGNGKTLIWAEFNGPAGVRSELIYDGSTFAVGYATGSAWVLLPATTTGGREFTVARDAGWLTTPTVIRVIAHDDAGNEAQLTLTYTVNDPAAGPDATAPVVTAVPGNGSVLNPADPVVITATDDQNTIARTIVYVNYASRSDMAYDSLNGGFQAPYTGVVTALGNGTQVDVQRAGGWESTPMSLLVSASDPSGNITSILPAYTLDPVPLSTDDIIAPTVSMYSPTPGSGILRTQAIEFDVLDNSGVFRRILVAVEFAGELRHELVHDGDAFVAPFLNGVRTPIAGGFNYSIRRTGGWSSNPTVKVWAIDTSGNEA